MKTKHCIAYFDFFFNIHLLPDVNIPKAYDVSRRFKIIQWDLKQHKNKTYHVLHTAFA